MAADICPSRDDAQPHIYEPSTGYCRFCNAHHGRGKDWRLCSQDGCEKVKMFHRSRCYTCWQKVLLAQKVQSNDSEVKS